MKPEELYAEYLLKIKETLEKDDFASIDFILEFMYSNVSEKDREPLEDILNEVTLYAELKEKEYKEKALELIESFKK